MLPVFFDLKFCKWDTLENETIELFVKLRTSPLSFPIMSQTEFTYLCEKFLINREVPQASAVNVAIIYKNHILAFTHIF